LALTTGSRLGVYEITAPIGEGGMGQVYRARDTRLDRTVALKILPDAFSSDADRVMRFTREAKTLAALNHRHIAQVYDAGREGSHAFIAMEFVDGEDLSARIRRGPMPLAEALPIARQIADALATAHDAGIVHRDLKPANVRVTEDGVVKVLDFGLARAAAGDDASVTSKAAATMTSPAMTAMGLVLGTAAYMAAEQAKGRPIDRRADVWAFGVVLYEMLTGTILFGRDDITETLAAVLTHTPDWSKLPATTPAAVRQLIERCLVKDKNARLDSMTAARIEIDDAIVGATVPAVTLRRTSPVALSAVALAGIVLGALGAVAYFSRSATPTASPAGLVAQIAAPADAVSAFYDGFALSPDGRTLAFAARNKAGLQRIWLRRLDGDSAHEVTGTDGGSYPFWAPDGRKFAFFATGTLKRVDVDGGQLQTICDAPGHWLRGSWSTKDAILWHARTNQPRIHNVSASGGPVSTFDALGAADAPIWLSNGERFLYSVELSHDAAEIRLASADGRPVATVAAVSGNFSGYTFAAGFLLLDRSDALTAQRFDEGSGALVGQAVTIAPAGGTPKTWFAVSNTADRLVALVQRPTADDPRSIGGTSRIVWADRQGNPGGSLGEQVNYWQLKIAPDGRSALVVFTADFWLLRPDRPRLRVTADGPDGVNVWPVWSHNGSEIIYSRNGAVLRRPIDPEAKPTLLENVQGNPEDWSSDGRWLLLSGYAPKSTTDDLLLYDMSTKVERPWLATQFTEHFAKFSPDGKWVAYTSDASGREETYVRAIEGQGQAVAVSTGGGSHPFWRQDGDELFYLGPADEIMSVAMTRSPAGIVPAKPRQLFRIPLNDVTREIFPPYAVSPDGQRFLLNVPDRIPSLFVLQGLSAIVK
jgi:hypothetical protein